MDDMQAIEHRVTRELLRRAGPSEPVDDAAIFTAITTTQSPKWRFQSMFSATKFLVAGAILALFGGFLLSGVLTQQPSDDRSPAVGASASATAQAEPTDAATTEPEPTSEVEADDTPTSPDLLPGVDLVTEEVEPGVHRVVSDGVRDLARPPDRQAQRRGLGDFNGNIVAGLDGSVWWFGADGFYRLGEEAMHRWPEGISENFLPAGADIEVGPDGTVWLTGWFGAPGKNAHLDISSYDGQAWSKRWRGDFTKRWALDVEVQQDGTVWMAWYADEKGGGGSGPVRVARLGEDDWEATSGTVEARYSPHNDGDLIVADSGGSEVWFMSGSSGRLRRHDGEGWVIQPTPEAGGEMRADVGPDGTLWVRLNPTCGPGTEGGKRCSGPSDILARFDGTDWEVYDSSGGIPMMGDHYQGFGGFFEVAPDRSIWFNPMGDYERTGTECDGLANFDGEAITSFLRDTCIYAMDISPDGTVWLQADEYGAGAASGQSFDDVRPGPIHTYVITPEAVGE